MERKTWVNFLGTAIIAAVVGGGVATTVSHQTTGGGRTTEAPRTSVLQRVLKQGAIRCGYVSYPPGLIKDANTGKISGIFADTLEKAAQNMGLRVDWAEEVGWGSMIEGLQADRYDAICSPVWANATRGKLADFTSPLFYSGIGAYVRNGDTRFDDALAKINSAEVKIATIDGEMTEIIAQNQFTKAAKVSHPQMSDVSQLLLDVADGKADVTFVEPYFAQTFATSHPNTVRNIAANHPIRIFPNTMMLRKGESELQSALNTALAEVINSGFVDTLIRKYSPQPGAFYPVAYPYRTDSEAVK